MSIFSNKNMVVENNYKTEIVACEGYDINLGGNYDAIIESCDDDLAIIEAMHAFDMAEAEAMKESGTDTLVSTPVMEASLKEMWAKIKAFFVKLGKRILAFFQSAIDYISSIVMSGTEFAKKYEERLKKLNLAGFQYEMYEYDYTSVFAQGTKEVKEYLKDAEDSAKEIADIAIDSQGANEKLANIANEFASSKEKTLNEIRNELSGESSAEKYREALYNKFRGDGKKKIKNVTDLTPYIKKLHDSNGLIAYIKKVRDDIKSSFAATEKNINKAAAEAEKNTGNGVYTSVASRKASLMRNVVQLNSSVQSILTGYVNEWSSVVKEATGVYKNLCFKALSYKPSK